MQVQKPFLRIRAMHCPFDYLSIYLFVPMQNIEGNNDLFRYLYLVPISHMEVTFSFAALANCLYKSLMACLWEVQSFGIDLAPAAWMMRRRKVGVLDISCIFLWLLPAGPGLCGFIRNIIKKTECVSSIMDKTKIYFLPMIDWFSLAQTILWQTFRYVSPDTRGRENERKISTS